MIVWKAFFIRKCAINTFSPLLATRVQLVNCLVTINSNIEDIKFQRKFYEILKKDIQKIKIESNTDIDLII